MLLNVGDIDRMVSPCKASVFHVASYHDAKRNNLSHGCTQKRNESFNGMIWNRVPKTNHVDIDILTLGVYDAIAHFNDGAIASLEILEDMNLEPGDHMMKTLQIRNESRKIHAAYWMPEPQLKRRNIIRHCRKEKIRQKS